MAQKRMFSKSIIDSDEFLNLPALAQNLYFHLAMRADDEGFINNHKSIQRIVGLTDEELKILICNGFVLPFDSGVIVIRHWKIHNCIQRDRFKPTLCTDEKSMLAEEKSGAYAFLTAESGEQLMLDVGYTELEDKSGKSDDFIRVEDVAAQIYEQYPRKEGKAKGFELIKAYLTKGKDIAGYGVVKFNHEQIYCAVREYQFECDDQQKDKQFIQLFSTFMYKTVIDYVEKSQKGYEEYMLRKYGNEWRNIKFIYK